MPTTSARTYDDQALSLFQNRTQQSKRWTLRKTRGGKRGEDGAEKTTMKKRDSENDRGGECESGKRRDREVERNRN